jgi:hypothetical protein
MFNVRFCGIIVLLIVGLACNGADVSRPADINDEDAIYHIIIYDRLAEFNMDLLDFSIPDTSIAPLIPDILDYYWFDLARDSLDLIINIDYPDIQDSLGTLPEGDVSYTKLFYGTLEIMGADSIDGEEIPVRRSKPFIIRAEILARFVKFGSDNNFRRGWLLRQISNVVYTANYPQGISQITINSASNPEYILPAGVIPLADIPTFTPGESLTVTVSGSNPDDIYRIRYPLGGELRTFIIEPDTNNNFIADFALPQTNQFNHFLVEVIRNASFDDNSVFGYEAAGVLFEVE